MNRILYLPNRSKPIRNMGIRKTIIQKYAVEYDNQCLYRMNIVSRSAIDERYEQSSEKVPHDSREEKMATSEKVPHDSREEKMALKLFFFPVFHNDGIKIFLDPRVIVEQV